MAGRGAVQGVVGERAHPIFSLRPESLQMPFLDEIVERVWQRFDPAGAFVRLQVQAIRPGPACVASDRVR